MTIRLLNFGPIKELTLDLTKNLHLLYGESSVGKSYAAYCVYLFLSKLQEPLIRIGRYTHTEDIETDKILATALNQAKRQGQSEIDVNVSNFSVHLLDTLLEAFDEVLPPLFQATFGTRLEVLNNEYSHGNFFIQISTDILDLQFSAQHDIRPFALTGFIPKIPLVASLPKDNDSSNIVIAKQRGKLVIHSQTAFSLPLRNFICQYFAKCFQDIGKQIFYLPASRLGLYRMHTSFSPIIAELATRRFDLRSPINLPSLTTPDADYIQQLAQIRVHGGISPVTDLGKRIETDVMKGTIHFEEQTKRIMFQPQNTTIWQDISQVSSMVAALAPLVLYLKYILTTPSGQEQRKTNSIFFILEEPEAHLHPTAQVKLMEILAELTKYNVRVMITSHSNYMFNKLGNMVLNGEIDENTIQTYHLVMTAEGSMDAGDMKLTKKEISDENFAEVSERLYDERMELYDKLNTAAMNEVIDEQQN